MGTLFSCPTCTATLSITLYFSNELKTLNIYGVIISKSYFYLSPYFNLSVLFWNKSSFIIMGKCLSSEWLPQKSLQESIKFFETIKYFVSSEPPKHIDCSSYSFWYYLRSSRYFFRSLYPTLTIFLFEGAALSECIYSNFFMIY